MKLFVTAALSLSAAFLSMASASPANAHSHDHAPAFIRQFPSCDLTAQHALNGQTGGSITDTRQAHIAMRANIVQADLSTAKKAGMLSQKEANRLYRQVEGVKAGANGFTRKQGFLSAGEVASYDRTLDAVTTRYCHG